MVGISASHSLFKKEKLSMEKKLIYERISKVMQEIGAVDKTQVNQQQRFNFRGIDDVYNACQKIMAKHEVFTTVEVEPISRTEVLSKHGAKGVWVHNRYHYTFHAVDGSSVMTTADGEALDYGDKASNKAAAISHKYALIQTFAIPTKLDDPDDTSHDIESSNRTGSKNPPPPPPQAVLAKCREVGLTSHQLIEMLGYDIASGIKPGDMGKIGQAYNDAFKKIREIEAQKQKATKKNG
jgi:hypothetical protein